MSQQRNYPSRQHIIKVISNLGAPSGILYLRGGRGSTRDDTDTEYPFRQESNFFYATGVESPGFQFICDIDHQKMILIAPILPPVMLLWNGSIDTLEELKGKYQVDQVIYEDKLTELISLINPSVIYTLDTTDTTPIASFEHLVERTLLRPAIHESRQIKSTWEIDILRKVAHISSHAHMAVMRNIKFGMMEYQAQAVFEYECARMGALRQSYQCIVASGKDCAVLHYTRNNKEIKPGKDGHTLLLMDCGAELSCYATDITRTIPVSGRFSHEEKTIYQIVLKMQKAALSKVREGATWSDLTQLTRQILVHEMVKLGIFVGDESELYEKGVTSALFPHGLGHPVGLDVHDVNPQGVYYPKTKLQPQPLPIRERLMANMVITIEPGVYFNDWLLDAFTSRPDLKKYYNLDKLNMYRKVGGVRIEDTVLVTKEGYEQFAICPKEVNDIEKLMAGAQNT